MQNKLKIINDPVHGFIKIPHEILFDIIEHPYFQRLRRIGQTGLLNLIFPGLPIQDFIMPLEQCI
jgi:HD superfamily phosphohydrolase